MTTTDHELAEASAHVLGFYSIPGGYQGGSFTTGLIRLWETADSGNRRRLAVAFPAMAEAIRLLRSEQYDELRKLAEGTS